jgi:hypothetical protein
MGRLRRAVARLKSRETTSRRVGRDVGNAQVSAVGHVRGSCDDGARAPSIYGVLTSQEPTLDRSAGLGLGMRRRRLMAARIKAATQHSIAGRGGRDHRARPDQVARDSPCRTGRELPSARHVLVRISSPCGFEAEDEETAMADDAAQEIYEEGEPALGFVVGIFGIIHNVERARRDGFGPTFEDGMRVKVIRSNKDIEPGTFGTVSRVDHESEELCVDLDPQRLFGPFQILNFSDVEIVAAS